MMPIESGTADFMVYLIHAFKTHVYIIILVKHFWLQETLNYLQEIKIAT